MIHTSLFQHHCHTPLTLNSSPSQTAWAAANNLTLNTKKSMEMIIRKPKSKNANSPPPPIQGIQRVDQVVVLGVLIQEWLSFKPHIDNVVSRCAQIFYALRVLKSDGLCDCALWDVANAVLIGRIMYASPAWWGFTDATDGQRLQSIINKAVKQGFLPLPRYH